MVSFYELEHFRDLARGRGMNSAASRTQGKHRHEGSGYGRTGKAPGAASLRPHALRQAARAWRVRRRRHEAGEEGVTQLHCFVNK